MCAFKLVKDNKVQFYEICTISEENGSLMLRIKHFNPDLKGWEEKDETVDFPLVKVDGQIAYFSGMTFQRKSEDRTLYRNHILSPIEQRQSSDSLFRKGPAATLEQWACTR